MLRHDFYDDALDVCVIFEPSDLPWDGDEPYDGPLWDACLYVGDEVTDSLGCIAAESDDPYLGVIAGELYDELNARREACLVRGEN